MRQTEHHAAKPVIGPSTQIIGMQHIVSAAFAPSAWDHHSWMALLVTLGYTIAFAFLGIKWFRWNTK